MEVMWKTIDNYPRYEVSTTGQVRNTETGKILKGNNPDKSGGYQKVFLINEYGGKKLRVHRLVAHAFINNEENKPYVNHINGIKTDNRVENLEWCTPAENNEHAITILYSDGSEWKEKCKMRFNFIIAQEMRELHESGVTIEELSNKYSSNNNTISRIINNKSYSNEKLDKHYIAEKIRRIRLFHPDWSYSTIGKCVGNYSEDVVSEICLHRSYKREKFMTDEEIERLVRFEEKYREKIG